MSSIKPPFNPDQLFSQAIHFHQNGKLEAAASIYETLLRYFPRQPEVLSGLGTLYLQQRRSEEGLQTLKRSLAIQPNQPQVIYNLALEYQKLDRLNDALQYYDQVVMLVSRDVDAHLNRGNTLRDLKRFDAALESYDRAIVLNPSHAPAYWNKALLKIVTGDYQAGWRLYEWGWSAGERGQKRVFTQPLWLGEQTLVGKTLLIHSEQGLGDAIQFCRYALEVLALGAKVVLEVPASLVALLSTLDDRITVVAEGQPLPAFDFCCPMMSLPLALGTTVETIPASIPYLHAIESKVEAWKAKLGKPSRLRVGLVWSGSMKNKIDLNVRSRRHIPLKSLDSLLQLPVDFHVLQKEWRDEDSECFEAYPQLHFYDQDLKDFAETAALIDQMDLVISVCTSVAHLAGALGKPVWLMLPYSADYRWMLDRRDSPWYPTAALFRQSSPGKWDNVVKEVCQALQAFHSSNQNPSQA